MGEVNVHLFDEAYGPMTLVGQRRDEPVGIAGPGLGLGYLLAREIASGFHVYEHVGAVVLDGLEAPDGPTKGARTSRIFSGPYLSHFLLIDNSASLQ